MQAENVPKPGVKLGRPQGLRTRIRTIRWISQLVFLALFLILITGTVCTVVLGKGIVITEPFGVLQAVVARLASNQPISSVMTETAMVGVIVFVSLVILLGRAFCAWACPVGTAIDAIDTSLQRLKFKPLLTRNGNGNSNSNGLLRNGLNKYAIMAAGLTGSALGRFPVWCAFCPIGTVCRGAIAGAEISIGAEILVVPAVGAMSLGEKRFWCRYLCPVGGALTLLSRLNPFLKPRIRQNGPHKDCGVCRKTCPEGIDVCNEKSLARCTKCFDCYAKCPFGIVKIGVF
jgi:ferredoxin-type protein NapH